MMIKLIAFDLDGTVVSRHHRVNPKTAQAVRTASENGIKIVVASGRHIKSMAKILRKLGLTQNEMNIVSQNAGQIMTFSADGELLEEHNHFFSDQEAEQIFSLASRYRITLFAYTTKNNLAYSNRRLSAFVWVMRHNSQRRVTVWDPNIGQFQPMSKIIAFGSKHEMKHFTEQLKVWGYSVFAFSEFHQGRQYVEISPPGVNKKEGIKYFAQKYGILPSEVMYFGDGENDIEAIKWAGIGVAMGNAKDHVKREADVITETVDDLGVAKQIYRVLAHRPIK